jgi:hypothetical protein
MGEHSEVDKVFNGGNIRNRGGNRRNSICKKGILLTPFGDRNIPIDGIFIVDDI